MTDEDRLLFESAAKESYGWDDSKLNRDSQAPGFYTDPLVQVAFDFWKMAIEAKNIQAEKPKGIHGLYQGIDEKKNDGIGDVWIAGITSTYLVESTPGAGKKEDTRWMNQIECYGQSKKEAQMLRDYVLKSLGT